MKTLAKWVVTLVLSGGAALVCGLCGAGFLSFIVGGSVAFTCYNAFDLS